MIASLYQSGSLSSVTKSAARASRRSGRAFTGSRKVLKVLLGPDATSEPQDVPRHDVRIQLDVVARPMPEIAALTQQIVHLVGLQRIDTQGFQGQVYPAGLSMVRVEIDDGQDDVRRIRRALGVRDDLRVVDGVEPQSTVTLQRGILPTNTVHTS